MHFTSFKKKQYFYALYHRPATTKQYECNISITHFRWNKNYYTKCVHPPTFPHGNNNLFFIDYRDLIDLRFYY